MIRTEFTPQETEFIINCLPNQCKEVYDILEVRVVYEDRIKIKVRRKSNGDVLNDYIRIEDMTSINRELIINSILNLKSPPLS